MIDASINLDGKVIAVINGIFTFRATTSMIAKMLYAKGAKMFYFITMAGSKQKVSIVHPYQPVKCFRCSK